jgi:hypothetical protein
MWVRLCGMGSSPAMDDVRGSRVIVADTRRVPILLGTFGRISRETRHYAERVVCTAVLKLCTDNARTYSIYILAACSKDGDPPVQKTSGRPTRALFMAGWLACLLASPFSYLAVAPWQSGSGTRSGGFLCESLRPNSWRDRQSCVTRES